MTKMQAGFTLIELMVVVAIAGVLAAFALPNYTLMVKNNCLTTDVNALVAGFQLARSEAIKRQTNVKISASNAGEDTNEWGLGWNVSLIEIDRNGDGDVDDAGEDYDGDGELNDGFDSDGDSTKDSALVRTVSLSCINTTIDETGEIASFTYKPTGFIDPRGSFDICDDRTAEEGRQITLTSTGRISTNPRFICD